MMFLRLHKLNLLYPLLIVLLWLSLSSCRTSRESTQVTSDSTTTLHHRDVRLVIPADSLTSELQELDEFSRQLAVAPPDGVVVTGQSGRVSYAIKRAPAGQPLGFVVEVIAAGKDTTVQVTDTTKTVRKTITKTVVVEEKKTGLFGWFNRTRYNVKKFGQAISLGVGLILLLFLIIWSRRRK